MSNIVLGKYIPKDSPIHKMNSVSKMISLLLFIILLFFDYYLLLGFLAFITIGMLYMSKVPLKIYAKALSGINILLIMYIIITLIFGGTWEVVIITSLKIVLCLLYTMCLTFTTSKSELTYALEKIMTPLALFKVPVAHIALVLTLSLRFIPSIFEQTEKIMKSQASRGIDFKHTNVQGKIIALSSMIVPMFILTSKKANSVADNMEVRLYSLDSKRSSYRASRWTSMDENIILVHIALLAYAIARIVL